MTELDAYPRQVASVVDDVGEALTTEQRREVMHLIVHGEPAEGRRTLAWIV